MKYHNRYNENHTLRRKPKSCIKKINYSNNRNKLNNNGTIRDSSGQINNVNLFAGPYDEYLYIRSNNPIYVYDKTSKYTWLLNCRKKKKSKNFKKINKFDQLNYII